MNQTNFCPHCHARQENPGWCDTCRDLKRALARARTLFERRRHLHTIHDWPPELQVHYHQQQAALPLFDTPQTKQ
jgi:hypothetical protein